MKRTSSFSDAAQREKGIAVGQQTLYEVTQAVEISPLALHISTTRVHESYVPWGKALFLSAMDHAPRFCQNGK